MTESDRTYDRMLTDHAMVKRWVRQHGGRPVVRTSEGRERLDLEFPGDDGDPSPIDWEEFFAHFEVQGLALACLDEADPTGSDIEYALVDRNREEVTVDDSSDGGTARPTALNRDEPPERVHEDEGEADERYHEAASEANPDAHRDERPFQS